MRASGSPILFAEMKPRKTKDLKPLGSVLRAVWLEEGKEWPLTPREVAEFDAPGSREPATDTSVSPSLSFSWERKGAEKVVPFAGDDSVLSLAARARGPVSAETRTRLSELLRQVKRDGR